jgi:hypothetical protein
MANQSKMVWAATNWQFNGDLIADVAKLGYIRDDDCCIDLTYGKGTWWKRYRPTLLATNDIDDTTKAEYHDDFRATKWFDDNFDVVAFDPPYISPGGRETSTIADFNSRFGLQSTPRTVLGLREMNQDGLDEARRICKPGGIILVKCMNYISSGRYQPEVFVMWEAATAFGLQMVDQFIMIRRSGPQSQKTQVHARNNYSVLLIFQKPK